MLNIYVTIIEGLRVRTGCVLIWHSSEVFAYCMNAYFIIHSCIGIATLEILIELILSHNVITVYPVRS